MPKIKQHIPILVQPILESIPSDALLCIDGTVGHGGHMSAIYHHRQQKDARFVGFDKDHQMLSYAINRAKEEGLKNVEYLHSPYDRITDYCREKKEKADFILLDIGINRNHVADAERGFSIKKDGPLDMRFDQSSGQTAKELLTKVKAKKLQEWLQIYGDFGEKKAEQIALHLIRSHKKKTLETTMDLKASLSEVGIGERKCAVVFQVIRIVVNDELGHLERFLATYYDALTVGGRCAIITFHSVEDRIVKKTFKEQEEKNIIKRVNKKVIIPDWKEQKSNKASRSAKLRIVEKI